MKKSIFVTGLAGAGKSTLSKKLREMGYASYDIETLPGLFYTVDKNTGAPFLDYNDQNTEHVQRAKWICDPNKLKDIIANEKSELAFYCGISSPVKK